MGDSRDRLITEQQLEIRALTQELSACKEVCQRIWTICYCVGGPLNDNALRYTRGQMAELWEISKPGSAPKFIAGLPGDGAAINNALAVRIEPQQTIAWIRADERERIATTMAMKLRTTQL
jgi:hypothetical protein